MQTIQETQSDDNSCAEESLLVDLIITFEDEESEFKFWGLTQTVTQLAFFYLVCTSMSSCSSLYTGNPSLIDSVLLTFDIVTVDISSAFFVVCGFVAAFVYSSVNWDVFQSIRFTILMHIMTDLWLSGVATVIFGSLYQLLIHRMHFIDIPFTLWEHATSLRIFDVQQQGNHAHSMNVSVWPVQCLFWCLFSVHPTIEGNKFLCKKFGNVGHYIVMIMAVCGVVLFTLFGMLHNTSNIFYANATNCTYRTLEFNLGIHFFYLLSIEDVIATNLLSLVSMSHQGICFVFVCIWWSELGITPPLQTEAVCLRLYWQNQCLRDHHAFLLRGCCLGITLICIFATRDESLQIVTCVKTKLQHRLLTQINSCCTAVCFAWPAFQCVQLILQISFGQTIIQANMALVSILQLFFLALGTLMYRSFVQPQCILAVESTVMYTSDTMTSCLRKFYFGDFSRFTNSQNSTPTEVLPTHTILEEDER